MHYISFVIWPQRMRTLLEFWEEILFQEHSQFSQHFFFITVPLAFPFLTHLFFNTHFFIQIVYSFFSPFFFQRFSLLYFLYTFLSVSVFYSSILYLFIYFFILLTVFSSVFFLHPAHPYQFLFTSYYDFFLGNSFAVLNIRNTYFFSVYLTLYKKKLVLTFFSVYSLFPAVFQILSSRHHPTFTTNFALLVLRIKPVKQFWNAKHFQMKMPRVREENTSFLIEFSRRPHDKVLRKTVCHFQSSKVYTSTHTCIKWLHVHKYHCI